MIKHLLPNKGQFYKTNLHTHTTLSDGELSPEEVKKRYMALGYHAVAFTDHYILVPHPELCDENFLALNSLEINVRSLGLPQPFRKVFHLNLYSYDQARTDAPWGNLKLYPIEYSPECANRIIREAHEQGFLVSYNHPVWSQQQAADFTALENVDMMEVHNSECVTIGYGMESTDVYYHNMCLLGKRIVPVATDDMHHPAALGKGWTMIKAESLTPKAILDALAHGDAYASTGPSFYSLDFDQETAIVSLACSPCREVYLMTERRFAAGLNQEQNGGLVESLLVDLSKYIEETLTYGKKENSFIRFILVDEQGRKGYTRAYFLDEFV